jgi:hypothetical protein
MAKKVSKVEETANNAGVAMETKKEVSKPAVQINRPKGRVLTSGASFWHFETEPVFEGIPLGTVVVDPKQDNKLVGYNFVDMNGEPWVIGATNAVQKAMNEEYEIEEGVSVPIYKSEKPVNIRWVGKIELKNGQTFNKFEIILLD